MLYVIFSPFAFLVGVLLIFFAARWHRKVRGTERWRGSKGGVFALYYIGGMWTLMGIVLLIYGLMGVK